MPYFDLARTEYHRHLGAIVHLGESTWRCARSHVEYVTGRAVRRPARGLRPRRADRDDERDLRPRCRTATRTARRTWMATAKETLSCSSPSMSARPRPGARGVPRAKRCSVESRPRRLEAVEEIPSPAAATRTTRCGGGRGCSGRTGAAATGRGSRSSSRTAISCPRPRGRRAAASTLTQPPAGALRRRPRRGHARRSPHGPERPASLGAWRPSRRSDRVSLRSHSAWWAGTRPGARLSRSLERGR